MSGTEPTIPEDRAQAIWRRAARLQAEAERRMEERARALAAADETDPVPGDGFRADDVEAVAVEAGISPEFVRIAMAEVTASDEAVPPLPAWEERAATRFLGTTERSIELARTVPATVERTVDLALRVLTGHPCLLQLRDVVDLPSLPGRAVVFDVPKYDWSSDSNPAFVTNAAVLGLRRVRLTVRALSGERAACEVVLSADLERGVRSNWRYGALTTAATATAGAGGGAVVAASLALPGALVALPALAGFALLGGLTAAVWGPTYRHYRRWLGGALEESLRALEASARAVVESPRALATGAEEG